MWSRGRSDVVYGRGRYAIGFTCDAAIERCARGVQRIGPTSHLVAVREPVAVGVGIEGVSSKQ
jgi:hypothetical protein